MGQQRPAAESKEKRGVWDPMPELTVTSFTLCPLQSRLQNIYYGQPYAKVDSSPPVRDFGFGLSIFRGGGTIPWYTTISE
jgi:hypothetical protein